jgi:hypothetical protein
VNAPEFVTEVSVPGFGDNGVQRLCSHMREPEPLPEPEPEPELEAGIVILAGPVEAAELAEAEIRYRNELAREMGDRGYERGLAEGYARAAADVKAVQHGVVRDAELEARRWGPGGRAHFADPRPGDFPGRAGRREPEPELEAG